MSRRLWPRVALGFLLSGVLLFWTMRDLPVNQAWARLGAANPGLLLCAVVLAIATIPLRAYRWRLTLRGGGPPPPAGALFHALALGLMANNLLPARTGELVRAWAARRLTHLSFGTAIASIALERAVDLVAILGLLSLGLFAGGWPPTISGPVRNIVTAALAGGGLILVIGLAIALLPRESRWLRAVASSVLVHLPAAVVRYLRDGLADVALGVGALRKPVLMASIVWWSVVIWGTNAVAFWVGLQAFQIQVPWTGPLLLQAFVVLALLLPSSPGYFGPFEAASRLALGLYLVPAAVSVPFALVFHLAAYFFPVVAIGFWSLARSGVTYSELTAIRDSGAS